jgi:hypothetical protein
VIRRAIYAPPALFGLSFLKIEPVEVELLEWLEPESPAGVLIGEAVRAVRLARIRVPVPQEALINILARIPVEKRRVHYVIREVPAEHVTPIGDIEA